MTGFIEQPGRLVLPMFLGSATHSRAFAGHASQISAFATIGWLMSKDAAAVMPGDWLDSERISAVESLDAEPLVEGHLLEYFNSHFWLGQNSAVHEVVFELGAACPTELTVLNAAECMLAMQELERPDGVSTTAEGARGCSLYFGTDCFSLDCAVAHFRAEAAGDDGALTKGHPRAVPVCQVDGSKLPQQGRTLFLSMCMGVEYFDKFCAPFLASYRMVYGGLPKGWHAMRVWTVGVEASQLQHAKDLFSSAGVEFEESSFEELHRRFAEEHGSLGVDYLSEDMGSMGPSGIDGRTGCFECRDSHCNCDPGVHDEKVVFNNIYFLQWVAAQFEATRNSDFQYMVFIDSDMLFVQDLGRFLPRSPDSTDWEYAFTVYDRHHEVPWGSNEDVAKTRNGFVRINAGVQLFRYTRGVSLYLANLLKITRIFMHYGETKQLPDETWFVEEFKGLSQAAIAWFIGSSNLLFEDCLVCSRTISFDSVSAGEPFSLKAQGLPARFLNQAESLGDGLSLSGDTHMVHLKGLWWRVLILNATAHSTATRCLVWNAAAYELWKSLYLAWRPETVIRTSVHHGEHCPDLSLLAAFA